MATEASLIICAVRLELGDNLESFRDSFRGTGEQDDYDLPPTTSTPSRSTRSHGDGPDYHLAEDVDYTLDRAQGRHHLHRPSRDGRLVS